MAWNEPGGNNKDQDPWGNKKDEQGPPDLDEVVKKLQEKFGGLFGGKGGDGSGKGGNPWTMLGIIGLIVIALWGFNGFYQVKEAEEVVVLRFGKFLNLVGPGLRWNPPLIDRVVKVDVLRVSSMPLKATMLTEDENIVDIALVVQYQVGDPKKYVLEIAKPQEVLHHATESALRHVVGGTPMDSVITEGREVMGTEVHALLQQSLDRYDSGLRVRKVNIQASDPPKAVKASFDDVIKAKEDRERMKNEAESYANTVVPEARGFASRQTEEANGYRSEVIARADGEAGRFERLLKEYSKAPRVTRERLYLETVESVLSTSTKVLVDVEGGNNILYLPLDKMMSQSSVSSALPSSVNVDAEDIRNAMKRGSDRLRQSSRNTGIREGR